MTLVQSQLISGVMTLRLERPEKLNALTNTMYTTLADLIFEANRQDKVRVVIITGGERCFTSGNDLHDFLESPPRDLDAPAFRFMRAVIELEKPLIAAVCGAAIGIGTTLLPHCDLVYITHSSKLSTPFVKLGLCQEFGASLLLPNILGMTRAARLLLCGEPLSGQQAAEWGLATEAFESAEQCHAMAHEQALRLAQQPSGALRDSKRLLRGPQLEALRRTIRLENETFMARLQDEEARNALQSTLTKAASR